MSNPFGIVHELTLIQTKIKQECAEARHKIHCLIQAIESGCIDKPQEAVPSLEIALAAIDKIST